DISLPSYKYCGIASGGASELGNRHSNLKNSIAEGSLECNSHDCWAEGKDPVTSHDGDFNPLDFPHLDSVGIWFGRSMSWANPHFEMQAPWLRNQSRSDSRLQELYGKVPWDYRKQSYDFRPKKGSYLIDSGVVIPGINDGKDEKDDKVFLETDGKTPGFHYHLNDQWRRRADTEDCTIYHHPQSFSGQNRKYIGSAPDIGAYEYGDSVY
ncbi:MAG TPA: LamG domain-containing protein, partial [Candidatus Marinimicrobia bacterium]|nr:LamG domain-containing protein [Candidatus Neomarinimicrobiota bacterium]